MGALHVLARIRAFVSQRNYVVYGRCVRRGPRRQHVRARRVQLRRARIPGDIVSEDVSVQVREDHVAIVEFDRPPNNFFDADLIRAIADAYENNVYIDEING